MMLANYMIYCSYLRTLYFIWTICNLWW